MIFDIEDVLFVDRLGEKALQWLNHLGARFVARNAYGVDLCNRLQLCRFTSGFAANGDKELQARCKARAAAYSSRQSAGESSDALPGSGKAANELRSHDG
jgi:hypothetical protein